MMLDGDKPTETSSRRLEAARILRDNQRVCWKLDLDKDARSKRREATELKGGWSNLYVSGYLAQMGRGIVDAVQAWTGASSVVYFWPGYKPRHRITEQPSRMMIDLPEHAQGGVGVMGKRPWSVDSNVVWFNTALAPATNAHPQLEIPDFAYPGTHMWLTEGPAVSFPDLLAVEVSDEGPNGSNPVGEYLSDFGDYGVLVKLSMSGFGSWATTIREAIASARGQNKASRERAGQKWPHPSSSRGAADKLGLALYELWLGACFVPERIEKDDFLDGIEAAARAYAEHVGRLDCDTYLKALHAVREGMLSRTLWDENEKEQVNLEARYKSWYSLRVFAPEDRDPDVARQNSQSEKMSVLGTGMILCSKEVPLACLSQIADWLQPMYMHLRQREKDEERLREKAAQSYKPDEVARTRIWPQEWDTFFTDGHHVLPHQWSRGVDPGGVSAVLYTMLGQDIAADTSSKAVHQALKGLTGHSALVRWGAKEFKLVDRIKNQTTGHLTNSLNLGSVALLMGIATFPNNAWMKRMSWPSGDGRFHVFGPRRTARQEYMVAAGLVGRQEKEGFFRQIMSNETKGVGAPGIQKAELRWDRLSVWLDWGMDQAPAGECSLQKRLRYECAREADGSTTSALDALITAVARHENGVSFDRLIRLEERNGVAFLEFCGISESDPASDKGS